MQSRRRFTKYFKLRAIYLLESRNRPAREIAAQLGVRRNQIYKWRSEFVKTLNVIDQPIHSDEQNDVSLRQLKSELQEIRKERDLYKKVAMLMVQSMPEED